MSSSETNGVLTRGTHRTGTDHKVGSIVRGVVRRAMMSVLVVTCALVALGGCQPEVADGGGGEQDSEESADKEESQGDAPKKAAKEAAEEEAEEEEEEEYERPRYPSSIRRNPFQPDREVVRPERNLDEEEERPTDPLEKYGLGELDLVVIISEVAVPKAMFVDPDGFGHVVAEGDHIGSGGGVITDIRDNEVDIRESGEEDDDEASITTVELRDKEISDEAREDDDLSDEERESLRRLLQSEEGQRALDEADGEGQGARGQRRTDERFGDIEPADD